MTEIMMKISNFFQKEMKEITEKDFKFKINSSDLLNSKIFLINSNMSSSILLRLKKREILLLRSKKAQKMSYVDRSGFYYDNKWDMESSYSHKLKGIKIALLLSNSYLKILVINIEEEKLIETVIAFNHFSKKETSQIYIDNNEKNIVIQFTKKDLMIIKKIIDQKIYGCAINGTIVFN